MAGSYQGSYNPSAFGWTPNSNIVAFSYGGNPFLSGVNAIVVPLFTGLIRDLIADGLHLPSGPSNVTGNWGYNYRDVRGSSSLSFHAYGLAIDIDAPHNGMTYSTSFRGTQPPNAAAIARKWGCQWGGEWSGRRDVMHYEVHCSPSEVAGIIAANGGAPKGGGMVTAKPPPPPVHVPTLEEWMASNEDKVRAIVDASIKAHAGAIAEDAANRVWNKAAKRAGLGNSVLKNAIVDGVVNQVPAKVWDEMNKRLRGDQDALWRLGDSIVRRFNQQGRAGGMVGFSEGVVNRLNDRGYAHTVRGLAEGLGTDAPAKEGK